MNRPNIDELLAKIPGSLTAEQAKSRFSHIWKTDEPLICKGICFPKTTQDVSAIMKWCHTHQQEIVVHGGLTNLVGGTQSKTNQLVVSLEKMNKIDTRITLKVWKSMINAFIQYEFRNFKKKNK